MSDTPRTDALMRSLDNIGGLKTEVRAIRTAWGQTIDFARRLERERDALRRKLAVAMKALREEGSAWPEQHSLNVALKQIEADDA